MLVVDDNQQNTELVQAYLESLPVEIATAVDGLDAMAQAERFKPDLVLLDVMMPKMSGFEVCQKIKQNPDLRDTEQIPLLEPGGIDGFIAREVLPYAPDAWVDHAQTKIGYEISFSRHFYKPIALRQLAEIESDIRMLMDESDGMVQAALRGSNE